MLCGMLFEAKCLKWKRQVIEAGIKRKRVNLRMNALLELKPLHPRKTMNCLQPSLITSLESPSDSNCVFVIVRHEIKFKSWDLCWLFIEKLPKHLCLSETVSVRHWLDEPSLIFVLLASLFHLCCLIIMFLSLKFCISLWEVIGWKHCLPLVFMWLNYLEQTQLWITTMSISLKDKWTVLSFLKDKQNCQFGWVVSRHLQLTFVLKSFIKIMSFFQFMVLFVGLYIFLGLV